MCQQCLADYLQRRRIEAGLEAPLPAPEPKPVKLPEPECWPVQRNGTRLVQLMGGASVVLDGRIPKQLYLGGHMYVTCLSPMRGNSDGKTN